MADSGYVREVYEASYRRLVAQAYADAGDRVEAEDAVQDAFARAVAAGERFRRVDNPEAWLRTVALNVLRRRWLPFQQRETVSLFYLGDLSVHEIADTLGVADGTVKSRLNRGRTALAGLLQTTVEADRG